MKLNSEVIEKERWDLMCKDFLHQSFGRDFSQDTRNYNFCVLVKSGESPHTYAMVRELDAESAYLNFGGVTKEFKGQGQGYDGFSEIINRLLKMYKRVGFTCRSNNTGMIKLGLNEGFEIIGMRTVYGFPHLEFLLERGH